MNVSQKSAHFFYNRIINLMLALPRIYLKKLIDFQRRISFILQSPDVFILEAINDKV